MADTIYDGEIEEESEDEERAQDRAAQQLEDVSALPSHAPTSPVNSEENKIDTSGVEQDNLMAAVNDGSSSELLNNMESPNRPACLLKFHMSKTPLVLLTIFSYLPGNVIYHRIALLDRKLRGLLNQSRLLDQEIVIT